MQWEVDINQAEESVGVWLFEARQEIEGYTLIAMGQCEAGILGHLWPVEVMIENETGDQLAQSDKGQHIFVKDVPGLMESLLNEEAIKNVQEETEKGVSRRVLNRSTKR